MGKLKYRIINNNMLYQDIYQMAIEAHEIAENYSPGQFINVDCESRHSILRRPISISSIDDKKDSINILYRKVGRGTEELTLKRPGERIDIIGPLGKGFNIDMKNRNIMIVGGGIGIAPLVGLTQELHKHNRVISLLGYKDKAFMEENFNRSSDEIYVVQEGSGSIKKYPTDIMNDVIKKYNINMVYTCGPKAMMNRVKEICSNLHIPLQISMEERMGCGIGGCLVCVCKTNKLGNPGYSRVCVDGPVFDGEEVDICE
jgi:dihydroorotate dehydrogenase electron transfer subunit